MFHFLLLSYEAIHFPREQTDENRKYTFEIFIRPSSMLWHQKSIILDEFVLAMDYIVSLCSGCYFDRNKQMFSIIAKTVEVSFDKLFSNKNNKYSFYEFVFTAKWLKYQNLCWDCIFCVNLHSFQQFVYLITKMKKNNEILEGYICLTDWSFFLLFSSL